VRARLADGRRPGASSTTIRDLQGEAGDRARRAYNEAVKNQSVGVSALAETHQREFLRYRKLTADAREITTDPRELDDILELDRRTDRILPNGWCLLPPRQVCEKGNACLTCDKFATDATFLPELRTQLDRTNELVEQRRDAFAARTGAPMGEDNSWLAGRRQEQDALGRIILTLQAPPPAITADGDDADRGGGRALRGGGVGARTDALTRLVKEA